jgi:hypothetical protein
MHANVENGMQAKGFVASKFAPDGSRLALSVGCAHASRVVFQWEARRNRVCEPAKPVSVEFDADG